MSDSEVIIGPVGRYIHQVQNIELFEKKNVQSVNVVRSNNNFLIDSGQSRQVAQIRLLFSGIGEINETLRPLIALFKIAPITSIKNELLSTSWKPNGNPFVPVCLEELTIQTVPDLPYSLYVDLTVTRIDPSSISGETDKLFYRGINNNKEIFPSRAYVLKQWILKYLKNVPKVSTYQFDNTRFTFFGQNALGEELQSRQLKTDDFYISSSTSKVLGISASIKNHFAYQQLIGKSVPTAQHMGSTGKVLSMNITFDTTKEQGKLDYADFCNFKETSDQIIRSTFKPDRVYGWGIVNPASYLLQGPENIISEPFGADFSNSTAVRQYGAFVPLSVQTQSTDIPHIKQVNTTLAETNLNYYRQNEFVLQQGGTDIKYLKEYFDDIANRELRYRGRLSRAGNQELAKILAGVSDDNVQASETASELDAYTIFWPVDRNSKYVDPRNISRVDIFGLLNNDTLRAALFTRELDSDEELLKALLGVSLVTGRVITQDETISEFDQIQYNLGQILNEGIFGLDDTDPTTIRVFNVVVKRLREHLVIDADPEGQERIIVDFASKIVNGFIGDRANVLDFSSETGEVIQALASSRIRFSESFLDALFDVIVKRPSTPSGAPEVFNSDGLHSAYFKLITSYTFAEDSPVNDPENRTATRDFYKLQSSYFKRSVFDDIPLPTYAELFGNDWRDYAPTYDDLGITNWTVPGRVAISESLSEQTRQKAPAVDAEDTVHPSIFYYQKKFKEVLDGVDMLSKDTGEIVSTAGHTFTLSIPFDIDDLKKIENIKEKLSRAADTADIFDPFDEEETADEDPSRLRDQLSAIISKSLYRAKGSMDPDEFRAEIDKLKMASDENFYQSMFGEDGQGRQKGIRLLVNHKNNYVAPRRVTVPGLGAEIYKVVEDLEFFENTDALSQQDIDSAMVAADNSSELEFIRHLDENTQKTIRSSWSQIPDDKVSGARMFPAAKVYLLDQRGDDLIADDGFFSINPVVSLDITLDKEDSDLAIIRIADPLRNLQAGSFKTRNIVDVPDPDSGENTRVVLGSFNKSEQLSYLEGYMIKQGRPIQIRMGYDSMPKNLPVVFTGRISEIAPGDVIEIVAQGWKAELYNKQVNFYNDDGNNWGAKDLAVQTIVNAEPYGFGTHFPQRDANFILRYINRLNPQEAIGNALRAAQGTVTQQGNRDIGGDLLNYLNTSIGGAALTKDNVGLDTRLKNIWYPDVPKSNNYFGWRSKLGMQPAYSNDGWIIPLQPAWTALREAARHAWNCVVQVLPYDGQATIFMGHPDQPYYFTRGIPETRRGWNKYQNQKQEFNSSVVNDSLTTFFDSELYQNQLNSDETIRVVADAYYTNLFTQSIDNLQEGTLQIDYSTFRPLIEGDEIFTRAGLKSIVSKAFFRGIPVSLRPSYNLAKYLLTTPPGKIYNREYTTVEAILNANGNQADVAAEKIPEFIIANSNLPLQIYRRLRDELLFDATGAFLVQAFFGTPMSQTSLVWPAVNGDLETILGAGDIDQLPQLKSFVERNLSAQVANDATFSTILYNINTNIDKIISSVSAGVGAPGVPVVNRKYAQWLDYDISRLIATLQNNTKAQENEQLLELYIAATEAKPIAAQITQANRYTRELSNQIRQVSNGLVSQFDSAAKVTNLNQQLINSNSGLVDRPKQLGLQAVGGNLGSNMIENLPLFKAFVYFYGSHLLEDPETRSKVLNTIGTRGNQLPPTMQVFRVHHWVDSDSDIIANQINASTKQMWNTVVIEHPNKGNVSAVVDNLGDVFNTYKINSGIDWLYYPPSKTTGVLGLQFHPGLTLHNKKIEVFTELNVYRQELAAKLACNWLAEGIRKMYRNQLVIRGRHIKPYDRVILEDKYTEMRGPLEVESVVHHWNADNGWITNIIPEAVCDANPGASILQTAALESSYNAIFNSIDLVSDALMVATLVAAPFSAGLSLGKFSTAGGLKNILTRSPLKNVSRTLVKSNIGRVRLQQMAAKNITNPIGMVRGLYQQFGGIANSLALQELANAGAKTLINFGSQLHITTSFVQGASRVRQLPVLFSPLIYQGRPYTAGLETGDAVYAVLANGGYYAIRDLQATAEKFIEREFGGSISSLAGEVEGIENASNAKQTRYGK